MTRTLVNPFNTSVVVTLGDGSVYHVARMSLLIVDSDAQITSVEPELGVPQHEPEQCEAKK